MTEPQPVLAPLSRAALILVVTVRPDPVSRARVREFCADLPGLVRSVGFRDLEAQLSCVTGFGAGVWSGLFAVAPPADLHAFQPISGAVHEAVATPGDVVIHVRAARLDLCFELASQILVRLQGAVSPVDEVQGFRFFDYRDLLGFVDGTENPTGEAARAAAQDLVVSNWYRGQGELSSHLRSTRRGAQGVRPDNSLTTADLACRPDRSTARDLSGPRSG